MKYNATMYKVCVWYYPQGSKDQAMDQVNVTVRDRQDVRSMLREARQKARETVEWMYSCTAEATKVEEIGATVVGRWD